jgi:hypothetical protein
MHRILSLTLLAGLTGLVLADDKKEAHPINVPPKGFTALFNGKDLEGWQICIPILQRNKLKAKADGSYEAAVKAANEKHLKGWSVKDGVLEYTGKTFSLQTVKDFGDFELLIDWKIAEQGDSGLYLRGQPQVQIWDSWKAKGAGGKHRDTGSGGLYNNPDGKGAIPLKNADKPVGQWNTFRILMKGDVVTVYNNGELVVDKVPLANYFEKGRPLPAAGPIELQHHGDPLWFRNVFIRELKD